MLCASVRRDDSITDVFPLFVGNPEAGIVRDELELGVRSFPVVNYVIYYRQSGKHFVIARVIHGMRDQKKGYRRRMNRFRYSWSAAWFCGNI